MAGSRERRDLGSFTRRNLEQLGFSGFVRVRDLRDSRPYAAAAPKDQVGVYIAFRVSDRPVSFLRHSPAGRWHGDSTLPIHDLRGRWVPDSRVVYIGRAERPTSTSGNSLRKRVADYLKFGAGSNARHYGGYPTWQLRDSSDLLIAWSVTRAGEAARLEGELIHAHLARFGVLPFANSVRARESSAARSSK